MFKQSFVWLCMALLYLYLIYRNMQCAYMTHNSKTVCFQNFRKYNYIFCYINLTLRNSKNNFYRSNPMSMLVRLGEWDAARNNEPLNPLTVNVDRIIIHPQFNANNLQNDLAIIKLNANINIPSNANVNTACRPLAAPVTGRRYLQTLIFIDQTIRNLFKTSLKFLERN